MENNSITQIWRSSEQWGVYNRYSKTTAITSKSVQVILSSSNYSNNFPSNARSQRRVSKLRALCGWTIKANILKCRSSPHRLTWTRQTRSTIWRNKETRVKWWYTSRSRLESWYIFRRETPSNQSTSSWRSSQITAAPWKWPLAFQKSSTNCPLRLAIAGGEGKMERRKSSKRRLSSKKRISLATLQVKSLPRAMTKRPWLTTTCIRLLFTMRLKGIAKIGCPALCVSSTIRLQ